MRNVSTTPAREPHADPRLRDLALALPAALAALPAAGLAWQEQGSILAEHWLPYAVLLALLVAVVLGAGLAVRPSRAALLGIAGLTALAAWTALSAVWSPLPALARDEALLTLTYGLALAVPALTVRSAAGRVLVTGAVVTVAAALGVAVALALAFGGGPADRFDFGRLASPIGYVNAQAAAVLVAFWPAIALAASRRLPVPVRALAAAAATALLAVGLLTQSKGGAVALAVSAIVVFSLSPARLRLVPPTLGAAVLVALSYTPLTEPFRRRGEGEALTDAAREAGGRVLVLTVVALVLGAAYALLDRRVELSARLRRAAGVAAAVVLVAAIVAGAAASLARVDDPGGWAGDRWRDFKSMPEREEGSSHLVNLGSNRYDFWRVALGEFREHPVAGIGARGWYVAYLQEGRSDETPRRAHSLPLDVASELGLVGLALLALALLPPLALVAARARSDLVTAGILAACVYWLVHAAGDWTWTFPAVGLPFFLLVGAGIARAGPPDLARRAAVPGAVVVAAAAVLLLAPPWLSARITADTAGRSVADPRGELTWARRLDPLSTEPLLAEAALARTPAAAVPPLADAAEREPRAAAVRYLLGLALLDAGRREEALRELEAAGRLSPRDERIAAALRRTRTGGTPG